MPKTNSNIITSIFGRSTLFALLLSASVAAQNDSSALSEQQAAQLRVAVEARIAELDSEYAVRATQLRRQFNARMRELEETVESELELSNAMAPISRVYQDSLAALQREINARKDSAYAAQNQANNELIRQGTISPETWAQIASTSLSEFPIVPIPMEPEPEIEPVIVQEATPDEEEDSAAAGAAMTTAPIPQASGCEVGWFPDRDRDLFGDANAAATLACYPDKPAGFVDNNYDCDDSDATVNPITGHCRPGQ